MKISRKGEAEKCSDPAELCVIGVAESVRTSCGKVVETKTNSEVTEVGRVSQHKHE